MSAIVLTELNVWLDVIFTTLYAVVLAGLAGHFLGNIITGRAKRRFGGWEWPHHEGPPIPFLPKFLHFQHVGSMIVLAVTGLYIRFPFFTGGRTTMRYLHYVAMVVVTVNLVWRLWYAFSSRQRDYREFAITRRDIITAPKVILYYIFVKPSKPHLGKYNVMQKATYTIFAPLLILQAFTGFALLTQKFIVGYSPRDLLVGWWLGALVGSTDLAGWYMRITHYVVNWLFIILTTIHVYLSVTEDFPAFLNFFGLSFLDKEHAGHEHEPEEGHVAEPAMSKVE
ncbi:MAG: cytochrome b/b6 domain-containing protein [Coriobacteriia bacterium]|nr:cytochrome b/b6 domain-containing protein [Coriobacteriia bacterium]